MTTIEKIKKLLLSKEDSKEVKMYAEMILDDGRVLATEDDQFMIGSTVMVVGDDGETSALGAGTYTMSDGAKLTIDEDSKILDMGEDKEAEGVEAEEEKEEMQEEEKKEEEMEEIDEEKVAMAINDATPDMVDMKKAREMAKKVKEMAYGDKEEMSEEVEEVEEVKEEEMVEMSKDMISSLVEEVEELKSQIVELEKTPGSEGFTHNPEVYNKSEKVDLTKMSATERAAYYINNK
jgi:nitric oxide reductase large subunit